jgi:hypothetical protein
MPECDLVRLTAGSFEPIFQLRYLEVVESRFTDFHSQCGRIQRGFTAPFGASELLKGKGTCFVEARRYDFRDVLDALAIAKTYNASARLTHGGSIAQYSLYVRPRIAGRLCGHFCNLWPVPISL